MAELNAAPAAGAVVIAEPLEAEIAENISLAIEEAVLVSSVGVVTFVSSRGLGRRALLRRFSSPGVSLVLSLLLDELVVLQTACQEPMRAFVAATHLPEAGTDPTRLAQV